MKVRTKFVCQNCGHEEPKWLGKCPACGKWDTLVEEVPVPEKLQKTYLPENANKAVPKPLSTIVEKDTERLSTGIREFDRVLGGGVVPGSLILLGGTPGIGKSTILLDAGMKFANRGITTLYVSGEESEEQTALRAKRLGGRTDKLLVMTATDLDGILTQASRVGPRVLVIDSIQTMYNSEIDSAAGSVAQGRECTAKLLQFAKTTGIAVLIIGHVTKDGNIAGPKVLEHIVDTVLHFEGERNLSYRILRAAKNRFGSIDEFGLFQMKQEGLVQIKNPETVFLNVREGKEIPPGVCIAPVYEGTRVFLVEIQALTVPAKSGISRIFSEKIDSSVISRVAAILEKHCRIKFSDHDIYVNVAGGIRIRDVGIELAIALTLYSARTGIPIPADIIASGELSLTGEVLKVNNIQGREKSACDFGFRTFLAPDGISEGKNILGIKYHGIKFITEGIKAVFGKEAISAEPEDTGIPQ